MLKYVVAFDSIKLHWITEPVEMQSFYELYTINNK